MVNEDTQMSIYVVQSGYEFTATGVLRQILDRFDFVDRRFDVVDENLAEIKRHLGEHWRLLKQHSAVHREHSANVKQVLRHLDGLDDEVQSLRSTAHSHH